MIFIRNDVFIRTFLVFNNDFTIFFVYLSTQKIATEIYNLEETQKHFYSTRDPISLHIVYGVTDLFVFFFTSMESIGNLLENRVYFRHMQFYRLGELRF